MQEQLNCARREDCTLKNHVEMFPYIFSWKVTARRLLIDLAIILCEPHFSVFFTAPLLSNAVKHARCHGNKLLFLIFCLIFNVC